MKLKNFDDFERERVKDNERDSLERELTARKAKREILKYDNLDVDFELIKDLITDAIKNDNEYFLTIGDRVEDLEKSNKECIHIEYEDDRLGRVKIYKPDDASKIGYYNVNGIEYEEDVKEIRDFYHTLQQEIKGQMSVIDKMTPPSDNQSMQELDKIIDYLTNMEIDENPDEQIDYDETYDQFDEFDDVIIDFKMEGYSNKEIFEKLKSFKN